MVEKSTPDVSQIGEIPCDVPFIGGPYVPHRSQAWREVKLQVAPQAGCEAWWKIDLRAFGPFFFCFVVFLFSYIQHLGLALEKNG